MAYGAAVLLVDIPHSALEGYPRPACLTGLHMLLQKLAEQAQKDLATAVAAAQQQEHAWQEQQVSAQVRGHMSDVQIKHNAELTMLKEQHARQQNTAQAGHTQQLTAMEAALERLRQRLEQVLYAYLLHPMDGTIRAAGIKIWPLLHLPGISRCCVLLC